MYNFVKKKEKKRGGGIILYPCLLKRGQEIVVLKWSKTELSEKKAIFIGSKKFGCHKDWKNNSTVVMDHLSVK